MQGLKTNQNALTIDKINGVYIAKPLPIDSIPSLGTFLSTSVRVGERKAGKAVNLTVAFTPVMDLGVGESVSLVLPGFWRQDLITSDELFFEGSERRRQVRSGHGRGDVVLPGDGTQRDRSYGGKRKSVTGVNGNERLHWDDWKGITSVNGSDHMYEHNRRSGTSVNGQSKEDGWRDMGVGGRFYAQRSPNPQRFPNVDSKGRRQTSSDGLFYVQATSTPAGAFTNASWTRSTRTLNFVVRRKVSANTLVSIFIAEGQLRLSPAGLGDIQERISIYTNAISGPVQMSNPTLIEAFPNVGALWHTAVIFYPPLMDTPLDITIHFQNKMKIEVGESIRLVSIVESVVEAPVHLRTANL